MEEKHSLLNDALRHLNDANERLGMAVLYRDFAAAGEVERAMLVKEHIEALPPVSETPRAAPSDDFQTVSGRYPQLPRIVSLLAVAEPDAVAGATEAEAKIVLAITAGAMTPEQVAHSVNRRGGGR